MQQGVFAIKINWVINLPDPLKNFSLDVAELVGLDGTSNFVGEQHRRHVLGIIKVHVNSNP